MLLFEKKLDKNTPIPLYFQLKNIILSDIEKGNFATGDSIPTENEMAEFYHISRSTIRQAIAELVQEGWLVRKASKGTFVTVPVQDSSYIRSFEPFYQQVTRLGKVPRTELIDLSVITPPAEIAVKMKLSQEQKVISMFRRRFADEVPMVTIQNFIPYESCSFILSQDFKTNSLYELLMSRPETQIDNTKTLVSASTSTTEDIRLLEVKLPTPMLCFHTISTTKDQTIVDFAFSRYRGDLNKFEINDSPRKI